MGCAIALLVLNFIAVCLALAGLVASLTGYAWYERESANGVKYEYGLFRYCTTSSNDDFNCEFRKEIFNTSDSFIGTLFCL